MNVQDNGIVYLSGGGTEICFLFRCTGVKIVFVNN